MAETSMCIVYNAQSTNTYKMSQLLTYFCSDGYCCVLLLLRITCFVNFVFVFVRLYFCFIFCGRLNSSHDKHLDCRKWAQISFIPITTQCIFYKHYSNECSAQRRARTHSHSLAPPKCVRNILYLVLHANNTEKKRFETVI